MFLNQQICPQWDGKTKERNGGCLAWNRDMGDLIFLPLSPVSFWWTITMEKQKGFPTFPLSLLMFLSHLLGIFSTFHADINHIHCYSGQQECAALTLLSCRDGCNPSSSLASGWTGVLFASHNRSPIGDTLQQCGVPVKSREAAGHSMAQPHQHLNLWAKVLMKGWHKPDFPTLDAIPEITPRFLSCSCYKNVQGRPVNYHGPRPLFVAQHRCSHMD